MPVTFKSRFINKPNITVDITTEMLKAGDIVAQEIRGNIKRGTDISENQSHRLNAPEYAKRKVKELGESKPLVAKGKTLISKGSYVIKSPGKNRVQITLSNSSHPISGTSIADIGAYNDQGTNRIPARHFFGISEHAKKRVLAMMFDRISELVSGVQR